MQEREYAAAVYDTVTGRVLYDLDLADEPEWAAQVNDSGSWKITVPLDGGPRTVRAREWCVPDKFSVAILRGAEVAQAGPITPYEPDDENPILSVAGKGIWDILDRRVLHNAAWNPGAGQRLTDPAADINLTDSLPNIAREIVNHAINMQHIAGSGLPIDLPALDPAGGDNVRAYHGYDLAYFGQRLRELTQVDNGPDVLFQPYITVAGGQRFIRHELLIGDPYLTQPGVDLRFFYRRNLTRLPISGGTTSSASRVFVKGSGNEAGQLYGAATATARIADGYPLVDFVDGNHTDATEQSTLDSWAQADVDLYSNVPEQWQATVLADGDPPFGTYTPGHFVTYSVRGHHWLPDGEYRWRMVGMSKSSGTARDRIDHQLQAIRAA
ncbi:hypothetical protein VSH64_24820 [Amycolatopsis rhabdoformis]|uniref:Minor tail protein n=1 Tax=Amycolatopsis rhabdoformis TaxID=1448059 RepID=A0ABZ1HUR3_9PSEU|nr:hypothetical protein [Amycolatopsis rhabdoformis]WSE26101.1 hypothetical protein VSH64_24820 [Amycolatopsis rhabdoformis]